MRLEDGGAGDGRAQRVQRSADDAVTQLPVAIGRQVRIAAHVLDPDAPHDPGRAHRVASSGKALITATGNPLRSSSMAIVAPQQLHVPQVATMLAP